MTDYREILRLKCQGISQMSIAVSCGCSRNTVANVFQRAEQMQLDDGKISSRTNAELEILLFPEQQPQESLRRIPDCEHIHKEMAKSGVTLTLLWH